jgi:hypothetical protein
MCSAVRHEEFRMIGRLAVAFLLLAVPAFGQSRVYTNADLDKIPRTRKVTEEELASLRANQFVAVPERTGGPVGIILHSSTHEGPFGPFYMPVSGPLDPYYYGNHPYGGCCGWDHVYSRGPVRVTVPNLSAPAPVTVPPFARGPAPTSASIAPVLPVAVRHGHF